MMEVGLIILSGRHMLFATPPRTKVRECILSLLLREYILSLLLRESNLFQHTYTIDVLQRICSIFTTKRKHSKLTRSGSHAHAHAHTYIDHNTQCTVSLSLALSFSFSFSLSFLSLALSLAL